MFDNIDDCDDMWTQLFRHMTQDEDYGEIWYWSGNREKAYKDNFVERWMGSFKHNRQYNPDVIFARGGFPEYDVVLKRYPNAFKIYYGAGKRFYPQSKFKNYDLILCDTPKQLQYVQNHFPNSKAMLWAKPAAENIFKPINNEKKYDVAIVGNWSRRDLKDLSFAFSAISKDKNAVHIGIGNKSLRGHKNIHSTGWIARKNIADIYSTCKMAIVTCKTIDSCPRVIPEALACDIPLLVLDRVNFWQDKYITEKTGKLCGKEQFKSEINNVLTNLDSFSPYEYYKDNLSMSRAVQEIKAVYNG